MAHGITAARLYWYYSSTTPDDLSMYTELMDNSSRESGVQRPGRGGSADPDCMSHRVLSKSIGSQMKLSTVNGCSAFVREVETPAEAR
jgi:hypothetical protein